ncbi:hypothetical protein KJ644_03525 [Candidatus Dependentiae bacterium]|nr:hypothetical protein [Candidatus Dependentiae bacterium]MBU4387517.1 hypothetical protein [Candidatus Dependentiae bacterium]MCG2756560.1 hypothetical protein [Candidatus Dependentiae bacterium]
MKKNLIILILFSIFLTNSTFARSPKYRLLNYKSQQKNTNLKTSDVETDLDKMVNKKLTDLIGNKPVHQILAENQLTVQNTTPIINQQIDGLNKSKELNLIENVVEDVLIEEQNSVTEITPEISNSFFKKIKQHFINNKIKYLLGLAGITSFIIFNKYLIDKNDDDDLNKSESGNNTTETTFDHEHVTKLFNEIFDLAKYDIQENSEYLRRFNSLIKNVNNLKDVSIKSALKTNLIKNFADKFELLDQETIDSFTEENERTKTFLNHEIEASKNRKDLLEKLEKSIKP